MMSRYWQAYSEKFNGMSRRERLILLLAVLAVVYLLWSLAFLTPASSRVGSLMAQKQALANQLLDLRAQEQLLSQAAGQSTVSSEQRQIDHLRQRLETLDRELQALAVGLVPANLLPQVLHDVLSSTGELELLGMQTLPVQKLTITDEESKTRAGAESRQVDVYRHTVELKVRGRYFAVANYLKELEALQWRFYWDRLNYQVERYPLATATLEVYTLSAGEGPLGE